jgi:hypothetical protein
VPEYVALANERLDSSLRKERTLIQTPGGAA